MDFEAFVKDDQNININHEPYTVHFADWSNNFYEGRNIQSFVKHV
jgi:hypothetical protein